ALGRGARPSRLMRYRLYAFQAALAALGLVGGAVVVDLTFDLSDLVFVTAVAGGIAGATGGPVARLLFRRAELARKDANAEALNKLGVDRAELTEDVAFGKYLVGQLLDRIDQVGEFL